jgi:uncharacterized SAM-binding protein YcdF (DUF218 family)
MKADIIIVLAHKLSKGKVSSIGKERLDKAVTLYKKGLAKRVLITGKEAAVMKKYLAKQVPAKVIVVESKSRNTIENAELTKEVIGKKKWNKLVIITSDFHMARVKYTFGKIMPKKKITFMASRTQVSKPKMAVLKLKEKIYMQNTRMILKKPKRGA